MQGYIMFIYHRDEYPREHKAGHRPSLNKRLDENRKEYSGGGYECEEFCYVDDPLRLWYIDQAHANKHGNDGTGYVTFEKGYARLVSYNRKYSVYVNDDWIAITPYHSETRAITGGNLVHIILETYNSYSPWARDMRAILQVWKVVSKEFWRIAGI
jgi:hypothetical protein